MCRDFQRRFNLLCTLTPNISIFTSDRLEVLNLLSSQAAVSIENAHLYSSSRANEKKYRTLFEDSKDAIFVTSSTGQILDINPAGLSLFGYSKEEMQQMDLLEIYTIPAQLLKFRQETEIHGSVRDFEAKLCKQDGTEMDCLITATIQQDEDGTILNYQGIVRDISAQKRAHAKQRFLPASSYYLRSRRRP